MISVIFRTMFCFNQPATTRLLSLLVCISVCFHIQAQEGAIDSLHKALSEEPIGTAKVDLLNALANQYYYIKLSDSLFHFAHEALNQSNALDYTEGKLAAFSVLSSGYWYIGNYEKALSYAKLGIVLGKESGNSSYLSNNFIAIGMVNNSKGDFEAALGNYMQGLSIAEENDNLPQQGRALNNIAFLYMSTGEFKEALTPLLKSIEINQVVGNQSRLAINYNNLGGAYRHLGDYENAFKYLELALELSKKTNYWPEVGVVLRSFGETYLQNSEPERALEYANKAIALQRALPSQVELIRSINLSASINLELGKADQAIQLAKDALSLSVELGAAPEESRALETLYQANKLKGNYRQALSYFDQYHLIIDSLYSEEKAREIGRLESKAEMDRQAQENERLLVENALNKAQIDRQKARSTAFVIITASLVMLVFGSLYIIRNKQRSNDQIRKQKEALEKTTTELSHTNEELSQLSTFKEGLTNMIAHDMKNSLNSIIGYSAKDQQDHRMVAIHQSGQNILNLVLNMLDVQRFEEAKVQLTKRKHSMTELMAEARDRVQLLASERRVKLELSQHKLPSLEVDGELIMRVMVNLLTNAIKYTEYDSIVTLNCAVTQKDSLAFLTTSVTDQGEGIEAELLPHIFDKFWQTEERQSGNTPSTGLGLTFCKLAIESHQGRIYAQSELGKGTTISFDLPLPTDALHYYTASSSIDVSNGLTEQEKLVLAPYAQELQGMKIYQVKALKEVINRLESKINTEWSKELMSAAFEGNKEKYEALIRQVLV